MTLKVSPADRVEESINVIKTLVMELQVVHVLPNVQAQYRRVNMH